MRTEVVLTIAGMALVTYLTRAGGFWLMGYLPASPRLATWLRALPGALLVALVAPACVAAGPAGLLAAGAAVLIARRTNNTLLAMVAGTALVGLARTFAP